jgi:hypothetical protein
MRWLSEARLWEGEISKLMSLSKNRFIALTENDFFSPFSVAFSAG